MKTIVIKLGSEPTIVYDLGSTSEEVDDALPRGWAVDYDSARLLNPRQIVASLIAILA